MTLSMIKLEPDVGRLIRWAQRIKLIAQHGDDDLGYALHALMAATFGQRNAPKPFVFERGPRRLPAILAYSAMPGASLLESARATCEPDVAEAIGLDTFSSKQMPDLWHVGQRFGFALRARPMVRTDRDGDRDRSREVDAFLLSPPNSNRGEVYVGWLREHLPGAVLESASLDAFRLASVRRRNSERAFSSQKGPEASFTGTLRVEDAEVFAAMLARGIGRHRAFGFGMLLLRPAR